MVGTRSHFAENSNSLKKSVVGEILPFLFQPLVLLKVNRLLVFLFLQSDPVRRQRGFEFVNAFHALFFVVSQVGKATLGFINPSLKEGFLPCTAVENLLRFFTGR